MAAAALPAAPEGFKSCAAQASLTLLPLPMIGKFCARSWLLEGPDSVIKVAEVMYLYRYCKTIDLGQLLQHCHLTNSVPDGVEESLIAPKGAERRPSDERANTWGE